MRRSSFRRNDIFEESVLQALEELNKERGVSPRSLKFLKKTKKQKRKYRWNVDSTDKFNERNYDDGAWKMGVAGDEPVHAGQQHREYFLAGTSINDHYVTKLIDLRTKNNLNTVLIKENFVCSSKQWINFLRKLGSEWQTIEFGDISGMAIHLQELGFIDYSVNSSAVTIKIYGSKEFTDSIYTLLKKNFIIAPCYIEWVYTSGGDSVNVPLLGEKLPISEMYPFLNGEPVEQFYDRFMNSSASILLLIGPPGTGKTTFIRGLLHHTAKNAIVTYDEKLLEKDYIFARFIEDDVAVMVLEDADNFLKSRRDGNSFMHRFLNVGDGLITVKGKKLVFSTNLPSISDIDPALVRPGRCFDILNFDLYNKEQAQMITKKLKIKFDFNKLKNDKKISLAEIFFEQRAAASKESRKFGFC